MISGLFHWTVHWWNHQISFPKWEKIKGIFYRIVCLFCLSFFVQKRCTFLPSSVYDRHHIWSIDPCVVKPILTVLILSWAGSGHLSWTYLAIHLSGIYWCIDWPPYTFILQQEIMEILFINVNICGLIFDIWVWTLLAHQIFPLIEWDHHMIRENK